MWYLFISDIPIFKRDQARGQLSPLLYNVYTDDLNHHFQVPGVGCFVRGTCANLLSYADEMVLLAPRVTALHKFLELWHTCAGPHDIVYSTTKTVCMLVRPKHSQGRRYPRVRLGNEELSYVDDFRYLGHIIAADCRDDIFQNNSGGQM